MSTNVLSIKNRTFSKLIPFFKSIFCKGDRVVETSTKNNNLVEEVVSSISDIVSSNDIGYNIFMELTMRLKDIDVNKYSELIKVFDIALEKLDYEWSKKDQFLQQEYREEHLQDIANDIVWNILRNEKEGVTPIEWTLKGYLGEPITVKFEAYHMDMETWELLMMYIDDSYGNEEGYTYTCSIDPIISDIKYPNCDCEMVSSTETIQGNHIDSNCDTWGTSYGAKAQGLFAFYITDIKKFAIVKESYWVY